MNRIHHLTVGTKDWIPTASELQEICEAFHAVRFDTESAVVTRSGITLTTIEVAPEDGFQVTVVASADEDFSAEGIEHPKEFSVWEHHTGNRYRVLFLTNINTKDTVKYPTTVIYRNVESAVLYSRPLSRWHASMLYIKD
jgi:hypothetical protein